MFQKERYNVAATLQVAILSYFRRLSKGLLRRRPAATVIIIVLRLPLESVNSIINRPYEEEKAG